jgi:hypothetical protein
MNQRIRELAEQAGFQYIKDEGIGWAGNYNSSLPKFAELLIRECAGACLHDDWEDPRWGRFYANKIREHFGVEK